MSLKLQASPSLLFDILSEGDASRANAKLRQSLDIRRPSFNAKETTGQAANGEPAAQQGVAAAAAAGGAAGAAAAAGPDAAVMLASSEEALTLEQTLAQLSPEAILKELLGDLFISPKMLEREELLGEGAYATVHKASMCREEGGVRMQVAVKCLKPEVLKGSDDLKEFLMEGNLMRKLKHRDIVRICGMGASDLTSLDSVRKSMYLVMEAVDGGNLKNMVIRQMTSGGSVYSAQDALRWCLNIASALSYLHEVCKPMIIHRDLKLENVLVTAGVGELRCAKLADFGLHKRGRFNAATGVLMPYEGSMHNGAAPQAPGFEGSYYGGNFFAKSVHGKSMHGKGKPPANSSAHNNRSGMLGPPAGPSSQPLSLQEQLQAQGPSGGGVKAGAGESGHRKSGAILAAEHGSSSAMAALLEAGYQQRAEEAAKQLPGTPTAAAAAGAGGDGTRAEVARSEVPLLAMREAEQEPAEAGVPSTTAGLSCAWPRKEAAARNSQDVSITSSLYAPAALRSGSQPPGRPNMPKSVSMGDLAAALHGSQHGGGGSKHSTGHGSNAALSALVNMPGQRQNLANLHRVVNLQEEANEDELNRKMLALLALDRAAQKETEAAAGAGWYGLEEEPNQDPSVRMRHALASTSSYVEGSAHSYMKPIPEDDHHRASMEQARTSVSAAPEPTMETPAAASVVAAAGKVGPPAPVQRVGLACAWDKDKKEQWAIKDSAMGGGLYSPSVAQRISEPKVHPSVAEPVSSTTTPVTSTNDMESATGSLHRKMLSLMALDRAANMESEAAGGRAYYAGPSEEEAAGRPEQAAPSPATIDTGSSTAGLAAIPEDVSHSQHNRSMPSRSAGTSRSGRHHRSIERPSPNSSQHTNRSVERRSPSTSQQGNQLTRQRAGAPQAGLATPIDPKDWKFVDATQAVGSLMYMAPELFVSHIYNEKVDVFSFAIMAFELFTGRLLALRGEFMSNGPEAVENYCMRRAQGERENIPLKWPAPLRDLIAACWHQDPAQRPAFSKVVAELKAIEAGRLLDDMQTKALSTPGCCIVM